MQIPPSNSSLENQALEVFRNIFETIPDALLLVDGEGKIILVNIETEFIFRYDRKELLGKQLPLLVPEELQEKVTSLLGGFLKDKRPMVLGSEHGLRGLRRNGTEFPIELLLCPLELSGKKHALCQVVDLTKRKQLEDALKEKQDIFQLLQESSLDGFWDWNLETDEQLICPRWKEKLGYQDNEVRNEAGAFQSLIVSEDLEAFRQAFRDHTERDEPFQPVLRYRHKDGSLTWAICKGVAIRDDSGKSVRMVGSNVDVTLLKQEAEKATREARTRLEEQKRGHEKGIQELRSLVEQETAARTQAEAALREARGKLEAVSKQSSQAAQEANATLEKEKAARAEAEKALREARGKLESSNAERARMLEEGRTRSEKELAERKQAEQALRKSLDEAAAQGRQLAAKLEEAQARHAKEAEASRRNREAFRAALEASPGAMLLLAEDGHIQSANSQAAAIFGHGREALRGMQVEALLPEDARPAFLALQLRCFKQGDVAGETESFAGLRKNGRAFPMEISFHVLETEEGSRLLCAVQDLTEKARSGDQFTAPAETVPCALVVSGPDGRITRVNDEAVRLFGWQRGELEGKPLSELLPNRFHETHAQELAQAIGNQRAGTLGAEVGLRGKRKGGEEFAVELRMSPIESPEGTRILTAALDLTEQNLAEERFRGAIESSPTAMVMVDSNGSITLANSRTAEQFGYRPEELLGQPVEILAPSRFRERYAQRLGQFFKDPKPLTMGRDEDLFSLRKDGSELPVEIGLHPIQFARKSFVLFAIADSTERRQSLEAQQVHDIRIHQKDREIREARKSLEKAEAQLKLVNRRLDEFASFSSRELQGPMRALASISKLVVENLPEQIPAAFRRHLEQLEDRACSMEQRIGGFFREQAGEPASNGSVPAPAAEAPRSARKEPSPSSPNGASA